MRNPASPDTSSATSASVDKVSQSSTLTIPCSKDWSDITASTLYARKNSLVHKLVDIIKTVSILTIEKKLNSLQLTVLVTPFVYCLNRYSCIVPFYVGRTKSSAHFWRRSSNCIMGTLLRTYQLLVAG